MKFSKQNSAGYLANHMARLFAQNLHQKLGPFGIAPAQFMVLIELWSEDGLTQKQLVERCDVEQATMANTLSRLERDGFVTRKKDKTDARSRTNHLTMNAIELRQSAFAQAMQVNQLALSNLDQTEQEQFLALSKKIIKSLKQDTQ